MNYYEKIMNIPLEDEPLKEFHDYYAFYKEGHRVARHAAAEIALEADMKIEKLKAENNALRKEMKNM